MLERVVQGLAFSFDSRSRTRSKPSENQWNPEEGGKRRELLWGGGKSEVLRAGVGGGG